jgi:hypothetical protein
MPHRQVVGDLGGAESAQALSVVLGAALSALVSDPEDGSSPDAALTWRDDSGAVLGTGPTLVLPCLTGVSQRTLTLTARDSVGAETTAMVRLQVGTICQ